MSEQEARSKVRGILSGFQIPQAIRDQYETLVIEGLGLADVQVERLGGRGQTSGELVLHLTADCNLNCGYCYQKDTRATLKSVTMPNDVIEGLLKFSVEYEGPVPTLVTFTGGEPLLRMKQVEFAVARGREINPSFRYTLITNGTLLKGKMYDRVSAIPELRLEVSFDGTGTARVYKDKRQTRQEVEAVIRRLVQENRNFLVRYTISEGTWDHAISDIEYILCFGVKMMFLNVTQGCRNKVMSLRDDIKSVAAKYGAKMKCHDVRGLLT